MLNEKAYKYSIRDTTEPLIDEVPAPESGGESTADSDYSIAQVRIYINFATSEKPMLLSCPMLYVPRGTSYAYSAEMISSTTSYTTTANMILYKGTGILVLSIGGYDNINVTLEGSIQESSGSGNGIAAFIVTGDGTITVDSIAIV